jgi:arylsulfatase A-like enzyme
MKLLLSLLAILSPSSLLAEPPNVLLVVGDDWGWTDFGFMGHPDIKTPHLDKLAAGGALFPNGYTPTSLCRASLATILTGQYAHQHKICCNDPPEGVDRSAMLPFMKSSPAIPRLLGEAKYRSFQTGKFWEGHFSNAGFTEGMTTKGRHGEEGLVIGRQTLKPIYDFVEAGKGPFFVWYAPMMPHEPHNPPKRLLEKYQKQGRDERTSKYMAMCEWTDETVGELLDYLESKKLTENTLILFVVDNGWIQTDGPVRKGEQFLTRSKNTPYDAGVRTPVLVSWKGRTKVGKYPDLVSTVDIVPTILDACGRKPTKEMTGESLLGVASGMGKLEREAVLGEIYLHTARKLDNPTANLTHRWVRSGDWKLIQKLGDPDEVELYDLKADPAEKTNRVKDRPEVAVTLLRMLKK